MKWFSYQISPTSCIRDKVGVLNVPHRPNIWPGKALLELEPAFKELGRLMMDVGLRLTEHCDQYVARRGCLVQPGSLQQILLRSPCPKVSSLVRQSTALVYFGTDGLCMTATLVGLTDTCRYCRGACCTTTLLGGLRATEVVTGVHGTRTMAR